MPFPILSRRQADSISNGFFLILLSLLFYTEQWWPSILFALGVTCGIRQYLNGRNIELCLTLVSMGLLGAIILSGYAYSSFFPLFFIVTGVYLIIKEYFSIKNSSDWNSNS